MLARFDLHAALVDKQSGDDAENDFLGHTPSSEYRFTDSCMQHHCVMELAQRRGYCDRKSLPGLHCILALPYLTEHLRRPHVLIHANNML